MGRSRLSVELYEKWNWRGANGKVMDMACRDLLRALDKSGKIKLPPPKLSLRKAGMKSAVARMMHYNTPVEGTLKDFQQLQVKIVSLLSP